MDYIYHQYIQELAPRLRNFKKQGKSKYNFSCPICGDSKRDKHKARGYILENKGEVYYYCHNDASCNSSFDYFLYRVDPALSKRFKIEKFKNSNRKRKREEFVPKSTFKEKLPVKDITLPSIASLDDDHPAKKYVRKRLIPEERFDDLYFCRYWMKYVNDMKGEDVYSDKAMYHEHPRLVIPLRARDGTLFAFQGRAFHKTEQRYVTIRIDEEAVKIYGQERIDESQNVYILEGPIDSMFIRNAIGLAGSDVDLNLCPYRNNRIFILDNEPRNAAIVKKYYKLVEKGEKIVSWLDCPWKEKDINDILLHNEVSIDQLHSYLESNTVSGLKAKLEIDEWKKVNV